ncbi:unnamed protein product [Menidia menidia]|uniref:(Atlantic silverside) hypothetical protein n=1 Tax=Menidia menidia TaxID=238744 RepID=A0A8S4BU52_9TELE|nr:unnamed protein product [Menidia menidia]
MTERASHTLASHTRRRQRHTMEAELQVDRFPRKQAGMEVLVLAGRQPVSAPTTPTAASGATFAALFPTSLTVHSFGSLHQYCCPSIDQSLRQDDSHIKLSEHITVACPLLLHSCLSWFH